MDTNAQVFAVVMKRIHQYIRYKELIKCFDIHAGDELIIASDITRLALAARKHELGFDINAFINSIKEHLTEKGTLLIPSYNYHLKSGDVFDIKNTRPITGVLALAVMNNHGFERTQHPLHSFMVWGKNKDKYLSLKNKSSFGIDSPFSLFAPHKTKMLCISTRVADSLTYVHYYEEKAKVSYRFRKKILINYVDKESKSSQREYSIYAKKPGWISDFTYLQKKIREAGIIEEYVYNGISFQLLTLDHAAEIIEKEVFNNKARKIRRFSPALFLKTSLKPYLYKLKLFKTTTDKIRNA